MSTPANTPPNTPDNCSKNLWNFCIFTHIYAPAAHLNHTDLYLALTSFYVAKQRGPLLPSTRGRPIPSAAQRQGRSAISTPRTRAPACVTQMHAGTRQTTDPPIPTRRAPTAPKKDPPLQTPNDYATNQNNGAAYQPANGPQQPAPTTLQPLVIGGSFVILVRFRIQSKIKDQSIKGSNDLIRLIRISLTV